MCFKHYEDGIIDYKITVILNPKASEAFYNLGVAYTILGSTQEASENFSKAIELQPELETYHQRFLDQWNTKMTSDSIENLKKPSYVDNSSTFQTGKSGSRVPHVHRTCWVRCTRSQRKCCTSLKRP
jgi:tetratricopeptide (TPR) repeat protein